MTLRKCECGEEINYDGYNNIEIEEGYLVINGDANCSYCNKEYKYQEWHACDLDKPFEVEFEEVDNTEND